MVILGTATPGIELMIGVGILPACACDIDDAKVVIDDCELDLVGLPGRTWKVVEDGAGEGAAGGGGNAGRTLANPGDGMVGVVRGVLLPSLGTGVDIVVDTMG